MARYNKYGFVPDQVIAEDWQLPNATTSSAMTNCVKLDASKSGNLKIIVCASSTTVELAGGATLEFIPKVGTTTTCATVLPSVLITEAVQSDASWASGEIICEIPIPKLLIGTNKYLELYAKTSADERADYIEAYLVYE